MTKWTTGVCLISVAALYSYTVMNPVMVEKIVEKTVYIEINQPIYIDRIVKEFVYAPVIIPNPPAVPIIHVDVEPLAPLVPWDSTKRTLLDCDQERQSERIALACNIYHEARSQTDKGQIAVGLVTRNRVKSNKYPNTYSKVVWEIRGSKTTKRKVAQFSWALDGLTDKIRDKTAWIKAWNIAGDVISNRIVDFTDGSLWYHSKKVAPKWRKKFKVSIVVGDHIFYRK